MAGAHPRAAAVEGRAPAPRLVLADRAALELRVRERGRTRRVEHAGHRPAVEGVDRFFRLRAREDVFNVGPFRGPGANSKYGQRVATAKSCCYGGLRHSIKLYSPRMPTDWNCRGQTDPAIQAAVKADVPIKLTPGK